MTVRNLITRALQPILLCLIFLEGTLLHTGKDLSLHAAPVAPKADESYLPDRAHPPLTKVQEAFKDWKFGMFIHWGPYSTLNKEWSMKRYKDLPSGEFERRAREFNPQDFDARYWVNTAKAAGARYITFVAKHHDGFCNFDSKLTDYTSMHTPAKKDFVTLLAAECHRQKMPLFIYYSPLDWHHPDFESNWPAYLKYWQGQIRELATNYGNIAGFWLDVGPSRRPLKYQMWEAAQLLHQLQPEALVMAFDFYETERNLKGVGFYNEQGQDVSISIPAPSLEAYPWELCDTINNSWFYDPQDTKHRSSTELIRQLVEIVGRGGNLLLNSGPMGSGRFQPEHVERLQAMGAWLKKNGAAIYSTRPGPIPPQAWGYPVQKGKRIFLHVLNWPPGNELILAGLGSDVRRASLLDGKRLPLKRGSEGLSISLPESSRNPIDTIVVLDRGGPEK